MTRRKSDLLDLGMIVFRKSIQYQISNVDSWIVLLRYNLSNIKKIITIIDGILFRDNLNLKSPFSCISICDMLIEISCMIIRIHTL